MFITGNPFSSSEVDMGNIFKMFSNGTRPAGLDSPFIS